MKYGRFKSDIRDALHSSFTNPDEFAMVVKDAYLFDGHRQYRYADLAQGEHLYEAVVDKVIDSAESLGAMTDLIAAAVRRRPTDPSLSAVAARVRAIEKPLEAVGTKLGQLERVVLKGLGFEDALKWLQSVNAIARRICRFEPQPAMVSINGFGTAFLVGPDLLLTADHVIAGLAGAPAARDVVLRFDCLTLPDGAAAAETAHRLADDWLVVRDTSLDFALIRTAGRPADDTLAAGGKRGFLSPEDYDFAVNEPLLILQHPALPDEGNPRRLAAQPLKLSFGAVDGVPSAQHFTYKVNTEPGSSGSPCMTQDLRIGGVHHYGDSQRNRGVTIAAIRRALAASGMERLLDGPGVATTALRSSGSVESVPADPASGRETPAGESVRSGPDRRDRLAGGGSVQHVAIDTLEDGAVRLIADALLRAFRVPSAVSPSLTVDLGSGRRLRLAVNADTVGNADVVRRFQFAIEMIGVLEERIRFLKQRKESVYGAIMSFDPEIREKEAGRDEEVAIVRQNLKQFVSRCWWLSEG